MTNEEKAKAYVAALVEKDQRWHELQKAQAKFDEAQSRAFELELVCFEPSATAPVVEPRSISKRVLVAFDTPKRLPQVAGELGLSRQQVHTAVVQHMRTGRMVRRKRGVYVRKDV
jgi:hypothetical protein